MSLTHLVVVQYLYQNMATASTHMRLSPCDNYPIKNSGLDNETISNIHDKILKRTLYDKNDGNINADKWYEFHKKIKKGE